jgi:hypothetical protein
MTTPTTKIKNIKRLYASSKIIEELFVANDYSVDDDIKRAK